MVIGAVELGVESPLFEMERIPALAFIFVGPENNSNSVTYNAKWQFLIRVILICKLLGLPDDMVTK